MSKRRNWVLLIFLWTFLLAFFFSNLSQFFLTRASLLIASLVLFTFILLGVVFDAIGVAVTAASETPFHAMSAKKVAGANQAVRLVRNADIVSNFTNDVVGDISGILSGAAGAAIVFGFLAKFWPTYEGVLAVGIASLSAALTVGGKAFGKTIAINRATEIVLLVGKVLAVMEHFGRFTLFANSKKNGRNNGRKVRRK